MIQLTAFETGNRNCHDLGKFMCVVHVQRCIQIDVRVPLKKNMIVVGL